MLNHHFIDESFIYIINFEIDAIFVYFFFLYLYRQKISQSEYSIIVYFSILVLLFQLLLAAVFSVYWTGLLLIGLILPLIIYMFITNDKNNIKMGFSIVIPIYLILAFYTNEFLFAIISLLIVGPIILVCHETLRCRIKHNYHTLRIKFKRFIQEKNGKLIQTKKKKIQFFQARVSINKLAYVDELDPRQPLYKEEKTWLQNFFNEKLVYGIEMACRNEFSFTFLIKTRTRDEAEEKGEALLQRITSMYRGCDGNLEIIGISKDELYTNDQDRFIEIKPPNPPFIEKFTLLKDFCNLYGRTKHEIRLYIIWKKTKEKNAALIRDEVELMENKDEQEKQQFYRMWQGDLFKAKFFVSYKINESDEMKRENIIRKIEGMIKGLGLSSRSLKRSARHMKRGEGCHTDIIKGNLYSGRSITGNCLDFDITIDLPIEKSLILDKPSKKPLNISKVDDRNIMIGNYIEDSVLKQTVAHVSINDLAKSMEFIGAPGTGKTRYLCYILDQLKKNSNIGVIYINLAKGNQEHIYPSDYVLRYGDQDLKLPYFMHSEYLDRYLEEISEILVGSIGLKNVVVNNMLNTMSIFISDTGYPPKSVKKLFESLLRYFEVYKYDTRFQTNITTAIKNRVTQLFSNPNLIQTLEPIKKLPKWFKDWRNGKNIFIDFSMCKMREKRLLSMLVLQIIRSFTPDKETKELQGIIVMDEIHQVGQKAEGLNVDDDEFIAREALRHIIENMVREFRNRGICFAFADQTAETLFDAITKQPSLKLLFRQDLKSAEIFTNDPIEQKLLTRLKDREAIVINGVKGEMFRIRTPDYIPTYKVTHKPTLKKPPKQLHKLSVLPHIENSSQSNNKISSLPTFNIPPPPQHKIMKSYLGEKKSKSSRNCRNCSAKLDDDAKYCFECGQLIH